MEDEDDDDEDDDAHFLSSSSPSPPSSHLISIVPPSNNPPNSTAAHHHPAVTVAVPPLQTITLALPIQTPLPPSSSNPNPSSTTTPGGREDCWSEGATSALIDAWGERYLELCRGNLKQKHWQEVADAVSSREDYTKPSKTDVQCKNRIDTLKKKYKNEKSKISSSWPFFHRLDLLIGPNLKPNPNPNPPPKAPAFWPQLGQFPQRRRTPLQTNKRPRSPPSEESDERRVSEEESDSLLPETENGKSRRKPMTGLREMTRAIVQFGEVYEMVQRSKIEQAVEMEKQRMGFARELELQRMQFFMKTQLELLQLKKNHHHGGRRSAGGGGGGSSNNHHRRHHNNSNNTE